MQVMRGKNRDSGTLVLPLCQNQTNLEVSPDQLGRSGVANILLQREVKGEKKCSTVDEDK